MRVAVTALPWGDPKESHRNNRMAGPSCAVISNLTDANFQLQYVPGRRGLQAQRCARSDRLARPQALPEAPEGRVNRFRARHYLTSLRCPTRNQSFPF